MANLFFLNTAKNGVYINLVKDVRDAFEGSPLVKIDCQGMHASDYKKIGAKLKVRVSCPDIGKNYKSNDELKLLWNSIYLVG